MRRNAAEPRNRPENDTAEGATAKAAVEVSGGSEVMAELVRELRERATRAEALADAERERADRYERERDAAIARLLPPPAGGKRPGWLRRVFGG